MFADAEGCRCSAVWFNSSISDIFVIKDNTLYTIKLTVCFETNFTRSQKSKTNRYKNLSKEVVGNYAVKKLFLEKSSLGFYTKGTKPFIKFLGELKIDKTERILGKWKDRKQRMA